MNDQYKEAIDAFDKLLDVLEKTEPNKLSTLQKSDLFVYANKHLAKQIQRLTGLSIT